jgi:hypothetical protein
MNVNSGDQISAVNRAVQFNAQLRLSVPADDPSMKELAAYIKETQRLRGELSAWLTLGEFLGSEGARIQGAGQYSVFRNPATGGRACVLVNPESKASETSIIAIGSRERAPVRLYRPFETPQATDLPVRLTIPAGRLAVVVEE